MSKRYKALNGLTVEECKVICEGKTLDEINKYFGKNMRATLNYHSIFNYKLIKHSYGVKAERNEMIAFLATRYNYESIGAVFGISSERVNQLVHAESLKNTDM